MANKKISQLDSKASLSLGDLLAVGDPTTGSLYKTTITDLKTLTGAGVVSFNGRIGAVVPAEGDYTLTQLGDVIITTAANGNILKHNGSNWVNVPMYTGTVSQYVDGTGAYQTFPTLLSSDRLVTQVRNTTGATVTKGTVIYLSGSSGTLPLIAKAQANSEASSTGTYGVVQDDIANNANGYVVVVGNLTSLDTSAFTAGVPLWLSPTVAGGLTTTKPSAPDHAVFVGIVTRSSSTQGTIEVKIQNGYELDELHNVAISSVANDQVLVYETSSTLWKNKSISTILGFTPISLGSLSASAPLSYNSSTGAFSISQANTSTNGYLSSTDWNTFNNKQGTITLTTTGTSGAATFVGGTLNIPNYAPDLSGYVPTSRTITINGTTYDLSANRSWTIDTYTLPIATPSVLGGVKIGSGVSIDPTGIISVSTNYQAPLSGTGFVKISGTTISYDNSTYLTGITSLQVTTALGYTPYNSSNPNGYTSNVGTVTSVGGTGTVSGLTLTGTVTGSGSLTLGGTLSLTSGQVTGALGYTPYNSSNPSGYITGINSTMVTNALGYTPYNSSNPNGYITSGGRAYPRRWDGGDINFIWSGQSGQPPWLWGGSDGTNMYVWNPSNFSVNYAASAGSVAWGNVSSKPGNLAYWDSWYGSSYLGSNGDFYLGWNGTWLSNIVNQNVRSGASPTFSDLYASNLLRAQNVFNAVGWAYFDGNIQFSGGNTQYHQTNTYYMWRDWGGWGGYWIDRNGGDMIGNWYALYAITGSISDIRYKKDIESLPYGLKEVMQLNPIKYHYNLPKESMLANDPDYFLGFSAQEVQSLIPEAVHEKMGEDVDSMKGMLAITMDELIPVVVQAIKEQQGLISANTSDIENIKQLLNKLLNK